MSLPSKNDFQLKGFLITLKLETHLIFNTYILNISLTISYILSDPMIVRAATMRAPFQTFKALPPGSVRCR